MTTGSRSHGWDRTITTRCGSGSPYWSHYSKSWNGVDTPEGAKKGENPYTMSLSKSDSSVISWRDVRNPPSFEAYTGTCAACGFQPGYILPPWSNADELELLSRLATAVRGHDFNLAVSLGEARESIGMIGSTARSLALSFRSLRRLDVAGALHHLGLKPRSSVVKDVQHDLRHSAGNAWLGLNYGWAPLINDVGNAAEALAANIHRGSKQSYSFSLKRKGTAQNGAAFRSSRVKVIVEQEETLLRQLGFYSPSLVAWELLPYSFVVDWFLPVGKYLETLAMFKGLKGSYVRSDYSYVWCKSGSAWPIQIESGGQIDLNITVNRTVGRLNDLGARIPLPSFRNPLSTTHALSAIALLQNAFRR